MSHLAVLLVAGLATATTEAVTARHHGTSSVLDDLLLEKFKQDARGVQDTLKEKLLESWRSSVKSKYGDIHAILSVNLQLADEILEYVQDIHMNIMSELSTFVGHVTLQSLYDDINRHCAHQLPTPIMDLRVDVSDMACVTNRLWETLTSKLKMAVEAGLKMTSRACARRSLALCRLVDGSCTTAHEQRLRELITSYVQDGWQLDPDLRSSPLRLVRGFLLDSTNLLLKPTISVSQFLLSVREMILRNSSSARFQVTHLIFSKMFKEFGRYMITHYSKIYFREKSTGTAVESETARLETVCSTYRDIYPLDSEEYLHYHRDCFVDKIYQSAVDLLRCAYQELAGSVPTWSSVPSPYFHSQCLCVVYNGTDCGVKPPEDVDPRLYCLSVLLGDLQRQISYRPAVTYLDYAFQTPVPVCKFLRIMELCAERDCKNGYAHIERNGTECFLKDLVSDGFNCSKTLSLNTYDRAEICSVLLTMNYVQCEGDGGDVEVAVSYYRAGDSTLVLFITYFDFSVRLLTLVTYVACPELRIVPGKLLSGYLATTLLRIVVVRATIENDMALAVRLDVAFDLTSTLCLTCYFRFLTTCVRDLRLPTSLSREEVRQVLVRSALLAWLLPAALSAAFFWLNDAVDSHVQVGQLAFLICNFVALLLNIVMFYRNSSIIHEVKIKALKFRPGVRKCDVYADILHFVVKIALLTAAGITLRLVLTQIQGLERVLGLYHALGTLQGFLIFIFYGCKREARAFWLSLLRRQNNPP